MVTPPCPICRTGRSFHELCLSAGLTWIAHDCYDVPKDADLARLLGATCYLCGSAPTEHAEHVMPRTGGGADTWTNIAGACAPCNMRKGGTQLALTSAQAARLAEHQAAYWAAWSRATPDVVAPELLRRSLAWTTIEPDDPVEYVAEAVEDTMDAYVDPDGGGACTVTVAGSVVRVRFVLSGRALHLPSWPIPPV